MCVKDLQREAPRRILIRHRNNLNVTELPGEKGASWLPPQTFPGKWTGHPGPHHQGHVNRFQELLKMSFPILDIFPNAGKMFPPEHSRSHALTLPSWATDPCSRVYLWPIKVYHHSLPQFLPHLCLCFLLHQRGDVKQPGDSLRATSQYAQVPVFACHASCIALSSSAYPCRWWTHSVDTASCFISGFAPPSLMK